MHRVIVFVFAFLLVASTPASAEQPPSSDWKVYTYNPSGNALSSRHADAGPSFTFTTSPDTALFARAQHDSIVAKTMTATFTISGATTFTYSGEGTPQNPCGTPATVRLYFSSNGPFGKNKDWYSNFWWSNSAGSSQTLANGTYTITATVAPGGWSNWNGKQSTERLDGFAEAAANPDLIGLSFGGGCFFENGVGDGENATFTLVAFTVN